MRINPNPNAARSGFSMVELLLSMAILSLVVVGLAELFSFTANTWSGQMRRSSGGIDLYEAAQLMRDDLEAAFPNRPVPHQTFAPGSGTTVTEAMQRHFGSKMLLPFEVNRRSGRGIDRSFRNADPSERFAQIAFVAIKPGASSLLPETFYPERHGALADPTLAAGVRPTPSESCLIGYYVAYTPNSTLPGGEQRSMKLFRHFRPGGTSLGQAQAGSTIRYVSDAVNHRLVPQLSFANQDLPFLFAFHASGLDPAVIDETPSQAPWPANVVVPGAAVAIPGRSEPAAWLNPSHELFNHLPPDSPVAGNVVAFVATPFKRIRNGDTLEVLGAKDLNQYLGLKGGEEWPALVVPDFMDVELSVVDDTTAALLLTREDWLVNWQAEPTPSDPLAVRSIRRTATTFRFRVCLHPSPPLELTAP